MKFLWPAALLLYLAVPVLAGGYVWMLRRPARERVRYPRIDLVARAAAAGGRWRRHVPAVLYLVALCGVIFTLARPVAPVPVPDNRTAVMLSMDVSRSMMAHDVVPTRLDAAKKAAVQFVRTLPRGAKVGLVSFSSYATLISPPTDDHDRVIQAINNLNLEFATAIGDGLLEALYALPGRQRSDNAVTPGLPPAPPENADRLPPATVVLLSDGQSNRGTSPEDAANAARLMRVRVYTVGLGSPEGTFLELGGRSIFVRLDEETLKQIAEVTGGEYWRVSSTTELSRVYTRLGRSIGWERRAVEVSGLASVAVAGLFVATLAVSLLWMRRLV
ncbi:MAG TPA: VWA domain-containing protein [bacterium]|nr:VWA domain-containing protein [bacterium]